MQSVLVVDDDEDINSVVRLALEDHGHEVHTARNGLEAYSLLTLGTCSPRLILLDLMMPEMNGAEFLAKLRADPQFYSIPVVVMSAHATATEKVVGAQALLRKPFDLMKLLELVDHHLPHA